MGRLDATTRRHLAELLLAFLSRDYRRAAEVHFRAGWVPRDRSIAAFAQACRSIAEPILDKPQNEISMARLLGQLFHVTETFGMETQPQLLLLQKTMLVAEGTGRRLAPDANMWWLARPLAEEWMGEAMRPEIRLREAVGDLVETMGRAPEVIHLVEQGAEVLARGQVRLHPDSAHALGGSRSSSIARWLPWLLLAAVLGGWLF
jgi:ubiquinone biosynthesis protein